MHLVWSGVEKTGFSLNIRHGDRGLLSPRDKEKLKCSSCASMGRLLWPWHWAVRMWRAPLKQSLRASSDLWRYPTFMYEPNCFLNWLQRTCSNKEALVSDKWSSISKRHMIARSRWLLRPYFSFNTFFWFLLDALFSFKWKKSNRDD